MKRVLRYTFALALCAALSACLGASASAAELRVGTKSEVDIAGRNDGYVTVRMTTKTSKKIKVKTSYTTADGTKIEYTYDLNGNCDPETFSLQSGDGKYVVSVLENVDGSRYTVIQTLGVNVAYRQENAPFLIPTQNVKYSADDDAVQKAAALCEAAETELEKVEAVYQYIVENIKYDYTKANKIVSGALTGYLPDINDTLDTAKGICFDFSSLLAAMLRSQGVPTKLTMGYVTVSPKPVYHAWNEVYITDVGWVEVRSSIYFDGVDWQRMDSTFAANNASGGNTKFIGDGENYNKDKEF